MCAPSDLSTSRERALSTAERDQSRHTGTGELQNAEVEDFDRDIERGYNPHDVPVVGDAEASTNVLSRRIRRAS